VETTGGRYSDSGRSKGVLHDRKFTDPAIWERRLSDGSLLSLMATSGALWFIPINFRHHPDGELVILMDEGDPRRSKAGRAFIKIITYVFY
jgi:hypothetical protein